MPPPSQGRNCSAVVGTPAFQKQRQSSQPTRIASEEGLKTTVLPAASAAVIPPQGMAIGKFQGVTTTPTPLPRQRRPSIR